MSDPVVITIPHRLGKAEAMRRMRGGLGSVKLPFVTIDREAWNGDSLDFSLRAMGQQATGTALIMDDSVHLTIVLPWLLQRFAELAGVTLANRTKMLLEKK